MLRAGSRTVAAVPLLRPSRLAPGGLFRCGCTRLLSVSSSSTSSPGVQPQPQPAQPQSQPPPGAQVVAKQVRTDQRGYKATIYYYFPPGATAGDGGGREKAGEEGGGGGGGGARGPLLRGTRYGKVAPPKDAASLQVNYD